MQIFARMTKVDEASRTVTGVIANEALDRSGEVFDYDRSKPHFEKWSTDIAKATDGKNLGNVRAMHGNVSAGITKTMTFDDTGKAISVVAEITDDNEWRKVLKGNYTGFSIGGSYGDKWPDPALVKNRYEAKPSEYSLVDLPCNPDAQFSVIKSDGTQELRKFETTTDNAEALAKWAESLTDGERAAVLAKIAPAAEEVAEVVAEAVAAPEPVAEVIPDEEPPVLELATADELHKAGARHSAKDKAAIEALAKHHAAAKKHLAAMDDHMASLNSAPAKPDADADDAQKLAKAADDLQKVAAERDELAGKLEKVTAQYAELLTKAAPPKGAVRAVTKDADNDATLTKLVDDSPVLKADGSIDHMATAEKEMRKVYARR